MALVNWSDQLSVNIRQIDEQHKKLVSMLNELHDAMLNGKGRDVLSQILDGLAEYTVTHFATEENLMKKYNYPGYVNHKAEHDRFVEKVSEFKEKLSQGQLTLTMEVLNFLKDWLTSHIMGSDKKYGPFLNERGIK